MGEETRIESELYSESTAPLQIQCVHIDISPAKTGSCAQRSHRNRFLNLFKACHSKNWRGKLATGFAYTVFRRTADEREETSLSVSDDDGGDGFQRNFSVNFIKKINWDSLIQLCKEWIKHPMNIALVLWFICVAVSSSMQALLLVGALNAEFPAKSSRNRWIEINNQVLNALFTLMSLYQHPSLFHHLVLICRWRPKDVTELRKIYCKNGDHRPREWAHMTVVVSLLHITCFSQYVLCGLYWGYTIATRPEFFENFFNAVGFLAPVFAGAYAMYSPLGRESPSDSKEEDGEAEKIELSRQRLSVSQPEWDGGIFDCWRDSSAVSLSFFCCFCVFGWNMERLGFGNMYVHVAMLFLLCFAPLSIFGIAAMHISSDAMSGVVAAMGMVLSLCGLLYGGFWRLQMRKRFKLADSNICCGSETATDYLQWLFCSWCSLAQEVRTANFYEVEDGSFYRKNLDEEEESNLLPFPLSYENRSGVISEETDSIISKWNATELENSIEVSIEPKKPPFQLPIKGENFMH